MIKIATPISHLFNDTDVAEEIIKYSDCLEGHDRSLDAEFDDQELFHCEIQLIHELRDDDFELLKRVSETKNDLRLLSFHMGSSFQNPDLKNNMYVPKGREYSRKELTDNAIVNLGKIKSIFGTKVDIAVESNNYYPTGAYNHVTEGDFISEVVESNKIKFVLDIPHAMITAHNKRIDYQTYLKNLPLSDCIQLHIGRYDINQDNIAYDAHEVPEDGEWNEVRSLLSKINTIKYLTVETYKDKDELISSLQMARKVINELS